jgi:asparagine synthase (glutamine-hydrolysing)
MAFLLTSEVLTNPPEDLLNKDYAEYLHKTTDPFLVYKNASERFKIYSPVEQMLLTDLTVQLPSQFLTKVDRATMAAGVEARVPILDEKMLKLAINIPSKWKVNYNQKKIILRDSQRNRLPKSILDGPKTGFSVPYQYWLKTTLYEYTAQRILDNSFLNKFHFNKKMLENLLFDHKNSICDNGFMLWKILQLTFQK